MRRFSPMALTAVLVGGALIYAAAGKAQDGGAPGRTAAPAQLSAQFSGALQSNDSQLASIEALVNKIEAAKTATEAARPADAAKMTGELDKDADELEKRLDAYAKAMLSSFDKAVKQAQLAAKSRGKEGGTEPLKSFEDLAVKHENRLKQLDEQGRKMAPKSGSIMEPVARGKAAFDWPAFEKIGDFFVSPAQAAIALTIRNACHQNPPNQAACAQAVSNGATQANAARAAFKSCWDALEGVRPRWWRAIRRAGCTAVLIAKLA